MPLKTFTHKHKEIVALIGRGPNCRCADCPVLYGDTCPSDRKTQVQEYLDMGFELMPSGRINHHLWYGRKFGLSTMKDSTWRWEKGKEHKIGCGYHSCCRSRKAYCHKVGCVNRREISAEDDLSDLKDI